MHKGSLPPMDLYSSRLRGGNRQVQTRGFYSGVLSSDAGSENNSDADDDDDDWGNDD